LKDLTRKDKELWLMDLEYTINNAKKLKDAGFYDMAALCIQLAVEKALKAGIAGFLKEEPPKDHNLMRLYSKIKLKLALDDEQIYFLRDLTSAAYETRYMDTTYRLSSEIFTKERVNKYMQKAVPIIEQIKTSIKKEEK
jgi:HEPN domain-containing protein